MKPAKTDYYDPTLKGKSDGLGMENLPIINPTPSSAGEAANSQSIIAGETPPPSSNQSALLSTRRSMSRSTGRSVGQPVIQSTAQSVDQPTNQPFDTSPILGRPKSFYISEEQDEDLDVTVAMLEKKTREKTRQKIDRSTVIRLILEEARLTSDQTVDRLANRLVSRLISQLTG